jgi:hypothetical protein
LRRKASIEPDEPLSWHPALRNIIENATGKAAALSLLVAGLAGDDARLDENQKMRWHLSALSFSITHFQLLQQT